MLRALPGCRAWWMSSQVQFHDLQKAITQMRSLLVFELVTQYFYPQTTAVCWWPGHFPAPCQPCLLFPGFLQAEEAESFPCPSFPFSHNITETRGSHEAHPSLAEQGKALCCPCALLVLFCFVPLLNLSPGLGVAVAAPGLGTGVCFKVATAAFKNGTG